MEVTVYGFKFVRFNIQCKDEALMARKYWLDLFTGKTWEEFLKNGSNVSGFRERRKKIAQTINPGII